MSFWSILTGGLVSAVGKAIDDNITNDEERMALRNELAKITSEHELKSKELENEYQKEITKRWESDNLASPLAKNIRPLTLIFLLVVLTSMAFSSGNIGDFQIADNFVELFTILAITAFGSYFGGRSYEKAKGVTK